MTVGDVPRLAESKLKQFQTDVPASPLEADADAVLLQHVQDAYSDFASEQQRNMHRNDEHSTRRVNTVAGDPDSVVTTKSSHGERLERLEKARKLKAAKKYLEQAHASLRRYEWAVLKELYEHVL